MLDVRDSVLCGLSLLEFSGKIVVESVVWWSKDVLVVLTVM